MEAAEEAGDLEQALKHKVMTTTVTRKMTEDCKKMLRLMGCPVIEVKCLIRYIFKHNRLHVKLKLNVLQW